MLSNQIPPDKSVGEVLRDLRKERGMLLREVAGHLDIDVAILSKMERGERRLTRHLVEQLAGTYGVDPEPLLIMLLRDAVLYEIGHESRAHDVIRAAEAAMAYGKATRPNPLPLPGKAQILSAFRDYLPNHPPVTKAWIFGSYARGDQTHDSDVDIALDIMKEIPFTLLDLADLKENFERLAHRKVDVVLLNALRPGMRERIDKEKQLFYERNE